MRQEYHLEKDIYFNNINNIDTEWSFKNANTQNFTHSFHSYPAKFIPQLANKLLLNYSKENEFVLDMFCGSGTTVVEALKLKRYSYGIDINPIACLITKCKTSKIYPSYLQNSISKFLLELKNELRKSKSIKIENAKNELINKNTEKLDYWYTHSNKIDLAITLSLIKSFTSDERIRIFLLTAFSDSLKPLSRWLDWSVKPQRDRRPYINKIGKSRRRIPKVIDILEFKIMKMVKKYIESFDFIDSNFYPNIYCCDNRILPLSDNSINLVVTSPPYLTSYEYADLHQLSAYWIEEIQSITEFRRGFIGSKIVENNKKYIIESYEAEKIISSLTSGKSQKEAKNYFSSMYESFLEMYRVMKKKSHSCIVIGNSIFKGKYIDNTSIFLEQLLNINFEIVDIIKREITSKRLTSYRDAKTGRILPKSEIQNAIIAYPTENIIIIKK